VGSLQTMYRRLAIAGGTCEQRHQCVHQASAKLERLAVHLNEVWSWDITKLKGPVNQMERLPSVRDPRYLQPLRGGLDDRPA